MGKVVEKERVEEKLPEGWKWIRLGDHVTKIGSGITPRGGYATYLKSGIPLIRSQNVHMNRFDYEGLAHISKEQDDAMKPSRVLAGDVLLNITGASIGRVCIVPSSLCPANVNQHVTIIRSNGSFESQFLSYYISNPEFQKYILDAEAGATRQALTKTLIEDFKIPLPPLPEQKRIVGILSDRLSAIEQARAATAAQLAAAKALPAAYLRQVFDSPEAQKWPRKKLGDVCNRVTDGTHQPPIFTSSGVPFIFVRNIVSGRIDFSTTNFVSLETFENLTKRCRPEYGDLLYSAVGSFGVAVVIETDKPFTFQRHIAHLKPKKEEIFPHFLAYYLNSPQGYKQSDEFALGGAQRTVTLKSLSNFQVPVPLFDKQKQLSKSLTERLVEVEKIKQSLQSQLDTINQLPAALLRQAFNGEL